MTGCAWHNEIVPGYITAYRDPPRGTEIGDGRCRQMRDDNVRFIDIPRYRSIAVFSDVINILS